MKTRDKKADKQRRRISMLSDEGLQAWCTAASRAIGWQFTVQASGRVFRPCLPCSTKRSTTNGWAGIFCQDGLRSWCSRGRTLMPPCSLRISMSRYQHSVALCPVQQFGLVPKGQEQQRALVASNEGSLRSSAKPRAKLSCIAPGLRLRPACFSLVSNLSRLVCNIESRRDGAL